MLPKKRFSLQEKTLVFLAIFSAFVFGRAKALEHEAGFKMPSNNIYCLLEIEDHSVADLRCDIMQQDTKSPPAPKNCPLSWGNAFAITPNGNVGAMLCHGDTTRNDALEVLPYGTEWNHSGFSCKSETTGLTCTNTRGHGFTLSRTVQRLF